MFFLAAAAGVSAAETLVVGSGLVLAVRFRACLFHRPGTNPSISTQKDEHWLVDGHVPCIAGTVHDPLASVEDTKPHSYATFGRLATYSQPPCN